MCTDGDSKRLTLFFIESCVQTNCFTLGSIFHKPDWGAHRGAHLHLFFGLQEVQLKTESFTLIVWVNNYI